MIRKFIIRSNGKHLEIKAGCFRKFTEKAMCRSRSETVRALRSGRKFFIQSDGGLDYHKKMNTFGKFNIMIEALRNLNDSEGKDSYGVCMLLADGTQYFHTSFPENPMPKRELAKLFNEEIMKGTIILISKNPEK
jgi:hypothetical protein